MKTLVMIISFLFIMVLFSFKSKDDKSLENTSWTINCIKIDNDTIFYHSDSSFTYLYNYSLNKEYLEKYKDSIVVNEIANKKFHDTKTMKISFDSDSTFIMTKMRSGGRVFSDEIDSGKYIINIDTVKMTIKTRNNYKLLYILNQNRNKLFLIESNVYGQKVYCDYSKN